MGTNKIRLTFKVVQVIGVGPNDSADAQLNWQGEMTYADDVSCTLESVEIVEEEDSGNEKAK